MNFVVRRARDTDREAILALVPRLVAGFTPPSWRDRAAMTPTDLEVVSKALDSKNEDPAIYVAEREGAVIGFIHLTSLEDYYRRRKHGHVGDIVVAEGQEGQGIATALLAKAEEWCRTQGYDWLSLSVFEQNERAERLYRKLGFQRDVIRLLKPLR
ncbi:MAG TPA: GNAT family N-acetyltransferase [Rhizomicrobium sp.]|jgi:GNAT superfamily N-acetyltransferase|nr:GNAT family N-acetyltransferase [Rhizomicrobium sp.]